MSTAKSCFQVSISLDDNEESGESTADWKHVVFLPFHNVWSMALLLSVFVNAILSVYDICYMKEEVYFVTIFFYLCEFFYLADIVLIIMHRNSPKIRKRKSFKYKSLGFIVINVITMFPLYEFTHYLSIPDFNEENNNARNYLKLKCLIRIYRIFQYINEKTNQPGLNISLILTLGHLTKLAVIGHLIGATFYLLKDQPNSWIINLKDHAFDRNKTANWFAISFTMATGTLAHNWPTVIKPENNVEMCICFFVMLLGFTLHVMVFIGNLISTFKKDYMNYFEFEMQVSKIMSLLEEWEVDEELKEKTLNYYTVFWQKRSGLKDMPEMFNLLPTSLKKEVTVDIFWEALRHSHFFVGTDMSFKRSVSLVMKSEFLLPGDFLFRIGELKTKMVYIVSGVVQMLSNEDDDSPIMSFSSGTILGETGCLVCVNSAANLRTATYCEIQTLYLIDLYKVLLNYPIVAKYIRQQVSNRIAIAKYESNKRNKDRDNMHTVTTINTIRECWNEVWLLSTKKISDLKTCKNKKFIRMENLDLLVLSDEVELRVESICLSGQCPFIMDPDTGFRKFCDSVVIFAVIVQSFLIPKAAFFYEQTSPGEMSVCFLMDIIYVLDLYLQISTAVKDNDGLITDFKKILVIRLKKITFLIDILATFPVDYIAKTGFSDMKSVASYKLLRLLKMYKTIYMLKFLERKVYVINTTVVRIIKYVFLNFFIIYWLTCLLYGIGSYHGDDTSWFTYNLKLLNNSDAEYTSYRFFSSLVVTLGAYTNYGATVFDVYNIRDIWFYFFITIVGHLLYSYGFSEITATAVLKFDVERRNRTYLMTLKRESSQYKIDQDVHMRVSNFLDFHYTVREGCQIFGDEGIFENAPLELKNEIVRHRIIHCLKKVPLFSDASDDFLRYIVAHSAIKLLPPGSTILTAQNKSDILYVVMRGYCKMSSTLPGDLERGSTAILQSGSTFPFLETFHDAFSFINVKAMTVVELLLIRTNIIMNAFQTYEADYGYFRHALKEHKKIYGSILFRKGARLPLLKPVKKAKKRGHVFEYHVHDIDDIQCSERAYREPFLKLGSWSFIRFLMMRRTIYPRSWFYCTWEAYRCIIAVLYACYAFTVSSIVQHAVGSWTYNIMILVLDTSCLVDLYIRMHCQYYNKKGILVTHPLITARHYIRTAFYVDLISFIPIKIFHLDLILGKKYRIHVLTTSLLFTRVLQLYRPLSGLTYLENKYKGKRGLAMIMLKYLVVIVVSIGCCQALAMLSLCKSEDQRFYCDDKPKDNYPYLQMFTEYYHTVSTCFTIATTGSLIRSFEQGMVMVILLIPIYMLRWAFMTTLTSKAIGGNIELTLYRDRMKSYLEFLKGAFVSNQDIQAIVNHYEYVWKKSQGMNMYHVLKYFHPQLEQDMAHNLYSNTLLRANLFQVEHQSLFQTITPLFHREYYIKDSKIIQCNDIQKKIFFVHEGTVSIYIANTLVCTLDSGGMFGCFSKSGVTRQTLTAITNIHSTVLTVDSSLFHKTLASFPRVLERLTRAYSMNFEYLQETKKVESANKEQTEVISNGLYDDYKSFYDKLYIKEEGVRYKTADYLINVHIYPISSIFILAATFINLNQNHSPEIQCIIYILDVLHLAKMYLHFHKTYLDPLSGRTVKDPYLIRKRYARSTFWFDFFTIVPTELMSFAFVKHVTLHNVCYLNRSFRFIFLVIYYYQCEERLSMKKHLKWTYMLYTNLFQIQVFVCLWIMVACPKTECSYNTGRKDMLVVKENNTFASTLIAYVFIINTYTGTGLRKTSPKEIKEIIASFIIALATQYIITNLCSGFTSLILVDKHNFSRYEVKFKRLSTYLQGRDLSPSLYSKVRNYCLRLWQWQRGNWLPAMIQESPSSLKENIMQALYGKHLSNHFLFSDTHIDFLRQLVVHLERFVFSPGDSIVEKGDSDSCMYFVNSGEVNVYQIEGKTEARCLMLTEGMSFGEAQGLFSIPHNYSYRAHTICDILILKKNKWVYLLKWFPASHEKINEKAQEQDLHHEVIIASETV